MEVLFEFNLENTCYTIVNIDMKLNKIENQIELRTGRIEIILKMQFWNELVLFFFLQAIHLNENNYSEFE